MLFYDFEVFKHDWLCVIIDMTAKTETVIVNNPEELEQFYEKHKNDIWVGFNNNHYDQYIMKAILCGLDPKKVNDYIIIRELPGWKYSSLFRNIKMLNYDVMQRIDRGLKFFEGSLGNMVKESSIDFFINRPLTEAEIQETIKYCRHDVQQTIEVFIERKNEFAAIIGLIKMFPEVLSINDIGLTKAQMSAKILECEYVERDDEFDLFVLPCIQLNKYKEAIDFFMDVTKAESIVPEEVYASSKTMMIAGIEHTLAWGGIHAGREKYKNTGKLQGRQIWHIDVASFYPRLMIFWNLLTRNSKKPEKFKMIYDKRIELKHAGKKKEQAPLKIVINGTYGISKSETSKAYDPRNANLICMNGQLMLIDLIEHLEAIEGFELIQSNTDGLIVSLPDTDEAFRQMDDICYEWETRCKMVLEFDEIKALWGQKDVNNYVFEFSNGKLERKGAYVKELSPLDYDLPIINTAVVEALVHGTPVEKTILACNDLKDFQMIRKISSKYSHILYGGYWETYQDVNPATGRMKKFRRFVGEQQRLNEKCVRIFASLNPNHGGVWKVHKKTGVAKMEGSPEHCFVWNDNVNGVSCPDYLDKNWYIDLARKRLTDFGVS